MTVYTHMDSPLGELLLVGEPTARGEVALASLSMPGQRGAAVIEPGWSADAEAFAGTVAQLRAYFAGEPIDFEIEFATRGTDFQRRVWDELDKISYGTTVTYGEIAARLGVGREEVRAVAAAIGANPLLVVRPCHRVIAASGALTGYSAGLARKEQLLILERVLLAA